MRIPTSTYRLQIHAGFDLAAAARLAEYLADLGADWIYLSPLLKAEPGSPHGYDVVDHSLIDPDRGGREGLDELALEARTHGRRLLVDIVPNHVGVATPEVSPWWWDVLLHGRESPHAIAFDIDWELSPRLRIPVLGDESQLEIVDGFLVHAGTRYPIAEGTGHGSPEEVHDRQHYELVHWTRADAELNYRRFFAVNSLAGIRVEVPRVFEESHAEILRWIDEGLVSGLRVDHPDGLLDPGGYLDDLARATDGAYVLVEKILEGDETLPPHWQAAGTTGYDALGDIDRLLVDPAGLPRLEALAPAPRWADLIHDTRRGVADGILASEVARVARQIPGVENAQDALAEVAACFPVYRTYLPYGLEHLEAAMADARRRRPELGPVLDALWPVLSDPEHPAAQRFQQTTGPIMAKGVEDTAFYRFPRLVSLTEVGGDPDEFSIGLPTFHERQLRRHAQSPTSMTTLSTHDTKRGEDVRARVTALSEVPREWAAALARLRELAPMGDPVLEDLLWETAVGAWPIERERLHAYAEKAAREASSSTNWTRPDDEFESRMHAALDLAYDDPAVAAVLDAAADLVRVAGWSNSLTAKLIQLTAPGVPDVYQGSELWDNSLVDPDNRRPVDFDQRRLLLAAIDAGAHPPVDESGAAKLLVTTRALRLRRARPGLFSRYEPVYGIGERRDHLVAFDRGDAITLATRLPIGLDRAGGWGDTSVLVPGRAFRDAISEREFEGGELLLSEVFHRYPVALLEAL
ncbi:malto-oligosyltrehalose synthase [Antiquaquibacter soli]|uniref:Malto-oligosyltrehalose synthase n=1 Tax=Antiquaquibacter soli TaxID=3064523 RepID=A0ABT9BQ53_9MICO|nr:malto-oligosyltrehalose synthase [Protaetiibacter sp. WY-16]MDO7882744.1 malto-oligosyltrehalose synthase [Protaetiibacter sp. WY-16]